MKKTDYYYMLGVAYASKVTSLYFFIEGCLTSNKNGAYILGGLGAVLIGEMLHFGARHEKESELLNKIKELEGGENGKKF